LALKKVEFEIKPCNEAIITISGLPKKLKLKN